MNESHDLLPDERPPATAGLIALGVLALLIGILFVAILGLFILGEATKDMGGGQGMSPELQEKMLEIQNEPSLRLISIIGVGINTIVGISLITASIGIFRRRPWGWKLSVSALSGLFGWTLISILLMTVIVSPRIDPMVEDLMASEELAEAPDMVRRMIEVQFGWGGMIVGLCCCLPFPVVLFIGLLSPGIRSQFFPPTDRLPPGAGPPVTDTGVPPTHDDVPPPQ